MTLLDPTSSTLDSVENIGFWASLMAMVRRWLASPAVTVSDDGVYAETAEEASYVVAPCGYRIRVPRPDDMDRSVGEILPNIREGLDLVPPLPNAVVELLKEIQNPTASAASVASIAASDPAMAASLIRAVNSAALGMHRKITSVPEAVSYLGFSSVKSLLLRLKLEQNLSGKAAASDDVADLWVHSLMVSYIAECLARRVRGVDSGFVSTLGLLHDIGKLVIQSRFPEQAKALRESIASGSAESLLEQESRVLGVDHAALGAQIASNWKLPGDLVKAIRWHHFPERAFEAGDPKHLHQSMYLVQIANQLAKYCYIYDDGVEFDMIADGAFTSLGFAPQLTALLDTGVCAAASRAVFFADEGSNRSVSSIRRFLHLHRGDGAAKFLSALDSSPTGTRQVDVDNELCECLFHPENGEQRPLNAPTTAEGAKTLLKDVQRRMDGIKSSAGDRLALSLVTRCVLASTIVDDKSKLEVAVTLDARRTRLAFRSPVLSFAQRFGANWDADAALLALESELANVLNLNWFESILTSSDGSILTFTTRAV
jgi:putative nucleotidyltransferase with HDIG domain